jgi:hypothetical protein
VNVDKVKSTAAGVPRAVAGLPKAAASAAQSLYDRAIDRVLARPYEITTADAARAVLDDPDAIDVSAFADQIQQVALFTMPIVRRIGRFRRVPGVKKIPWVFSLVTITNLTRSIRQGVREVQVIGSYVAARIERATGRPPDPDLVKRLTVQLYLSPTRKADPTVPESLEARKLLQRWLFNGFLGRTTNKTAVRAIGAVERLDVSALLRGLPPADVDA